MLVNAIQGEVSQLTANFARNMTLRLYTNNVSPTLAFTEASVTEASGNGYGAKALTGGSWTITAGRSGVDGVGNNTTTVTSASASFAAGDVGREFYVIVSGMLYKTTIASVTNSTTAVMANAIPTGTGLAWWIPSIASYAEQTFTFSGALGNVYGYYVTLDADSKYQFGEKFSDGPYNIQNNGDSIKVTPKFTQG